MSLACVMPASPVSGVFAGVAGRCRGAERQAQVIQDEGSYYIVMVLGKGLSESK